MKKFLTMLLFFSIPIIAVAVVFEFSLRNIPNDYRYKKQFLDQNAKNIEVLFLGSSHAYYGINPKYMQSKSFNAANISQTLEYDLNILEKYRNDWKNLKYVVLPVDYFSLFSRLDFGVENWRTKNYVIYYGMDSNFNPRHRFEIFANQTKYNFERFRNYYVHQKSDLNVTRLGWGNRYHAAESLNLSEVGIVAAQRHRSVSKESFFAENIKTLDTIADFCKKRNIKLILFTSPAYKTYVKNIDAKQMNRTINVLEAFAASNKSVRYYNLLTDSRFDSIDFYDADHLNDMGAKKLSIEMNRILKSQKP